MFDLFVLFWATVGFLYILNRLSHIEAKIRRLESRGDNTSQSEQTTLANVPLSEQVTYSNAVPPIPASTFSSIADSPSATDGLLEWMRKDFLVKLGGLLLLIAFGWFVSYAFANNWIGPIGRISLGILAGIAFMGLGMWRIVRFPHQGSIFVVIGSTTILLTIFAAREIYDFFTPLSALTVMFMSVVFVAFCAVRYKEPQLAYASVVMAGIAPLLTNSPDPNALSLYSYLLVIVLGTIWIITRLNVPWAALLSFFVVFFYSLEYFFSGGSGYEGFFVALQFGFAFSLLFLLINMLSITKNAVDQAEPAQLSLAGGTALYVMLWISIGFDTGWQSILYTAWAMVFAVGAFVVFVHFQKKALFYVYGAMSAVFLAAATAALFSGTSLVVAYTIEITALLYAGLRVGIDPGVMNRLSLLYVVPVLLSLESVFANEWSESVMHEHFFVLLVLAICLAFAARLLWVPRVGKAENEHSPMVYVLVFGCIAYGLILVWLVTHALFSYDVGTFISLTIYTIMGLGTYLYGTRTDSYGFRISGGLLIGFVIARLLLIDIWQMEISGRIITFFVIGALLISTAFISKVKNKNDHE